MRPPPPADWPFAEHSRIVACAPHRWHVQQFGTGPDVVLLHGAGAATHSWRGLAPLLAPHVRLTLLDLPGHGFTQVGSRNRFGLAETSADITSLLSSLGVVPKAIIGHSAGAAIALRLSLDAGRILPVVSINGAFQMFGGIAGVVFPLMAKALAINPLTVPLFTAGASRARTRRMLDGTGSVLDDHGIDLYHRLISDRDHVSGALSMMAQWSLDRLVRDAAHLDAPVLLLAGDRDRTVPPKISREMAARLTHGTLIHETDLGHLMHEEAPQIVAERCLSFLSIQGADPA
ncbi:alpha/beta fold hydrolase BchO [Jannaschia sp. 2305UL9-9]|uniref:alpha/beta fold hydrolase BchO n=1 Tax=Jannaschia sp. 2305UL9-9 TaxID=3121638 RepID=UPI00352723E1